ncbi:Deubiquitinase MYSM1 [Halotydeus destructor]|nr:Deubiquitinase MYSM1 [Halotydeus destructor]
MKKNNKEDDEPVVPNDDNGSLDNPTDSAINNAISVIPTQKRTSGTPKASRTRPNSNPFKLICCDKYGDEDAIDAPFTLDFSVEALVVIDVHAHCVQTEVIGLLGGLYSHTLKCLIVMSAEPCRSITDNTTDLQCEMDPVSQAEASEKIRASELSVVGWYHSHPTFVPNPSLRDLETQAKYQELFKEGDMPFIAFIMSPYAGSINPAQKHTLPSKFKCLMVSEETNQQGNYRVPYEFLPRIVRKDRLRCNLLHRVQILCSYLDGQKTSFCMIDRIRGKDLLLVNKMAFSLKFYLQKAGLSSKEADMSIDCIKELVLKHLSTRNK